MKSEDIGFTILGCVGLLLLFSLVVLFAVQAHQTDLRRISSGLQECLVAKPGTSTDKLWQKECQP